MPVGKVLVAGATSSETREVLGRLAEVPARPEGGDVGGGGMLGLLRELVPQELLGALGGPVVRQDSRPSANMFLLRSASLRDSSNSLSASTVIVVSGTGWTAYPSSEPSSSGLAA